MSATHCFAPPPSSLPTPTHPPAIANPLRGFLAYTVRTRGGYDSDASYQSVPASGLGSDELRADVDPFAALPAYRRLHRVKRGGSSDDDSDYEQGEEEVDEDDEEDDDEVLLEDGRPRKRRFGGGTTATKAKKAPRSQSKHAHRVDDEDDEEHDEHHDDEDSDEVVPPAKKSRERPTTAPKANKAPRSVTRDIAAPIVPASGEFLASASAFRGAAGIEPLPADQEEVKVDCVFLCVGYCMHFKVGEE